MLPRVQRMASILGFSLTAALLALPCAASAQHVQPGDRLVVRVFGGEQPYADTILVAPNGTVVLPRLGPTLVTGFESAALPDSLRARYARFLRTPTVDVVVLRRVSVFGEVKKPDIYYIDAAASLPDLIARAGGLTEYASTSKVSLRRQGITTRLPNWRDDQSAVGALQSGDQLYVARRPWLSLNFVSVASTAAVLTSIYISLRR